MSEYLSQGYTSVVSSEEGLLNWFAPRSLFAATINWGWLSTYMQLHLNLDRVLSLYLELRLVWLAMQYVNTWVFNGTKTVSDVLGHTVYWVLVVCLSNISLSSFIFLTSSVIRPCHQCCCSDLASFSHFQTRRTFRSFESALHAKSGFYLNSLQKQGWHLLRAKDLNSWVNLTTRW